jgi:hypothetical protein
MLTGPIFRSLVDSRQGCWVKPSMNHLRPCAGRPMYYVGCGRVAAAFRVDPNDDRSRKIFSSELDVRICPGNRVAVNHD